MKYVYLMLSDRGKDSEWIRSKGINEKTVMTVPDREWEDKSTVVIVSKPEGGSIALSKDTLQKVGTHHDGNPF